MCEKTYFRQAIDDDAAGVGTLRRFEYTARRLAQLKVGRIQQALPLTFVKETLGRYKLEHVDGTRDGPAMGGRCLTQLLRGFWPKALFGVAGLDDILSGGLARNHLYLVEGTLLRLS